MKMIVMNLQLTSTSTQPDHENVNEDTQDRDYLQDENQNDSEEEVDKEEILVSQKEINEALNNIKPGKKFPTWLYRVVKKNGLEEYLKT